MDAKYEYVSSRRDVAIVGGSFGKELRVSLGGETHVIRTDSDEPKIVLFANAYEATGNDGTKSLFVVKSLVPMRYRRVEIGREYASEDSGGSPAVESFPSVVHGTSLTKDDLSRHLVEDGVYDNAPSLRATVLLVTLGRGSLSADEWTEASCVELLAGMRSGDISSVTLNTDGRMAVGIVGEVSDMAEVAIESAIAFDAYARRMLILRGEQTPDESRFQMCSDHRGLTKSLSSNILHSLPMFLASELNGDEKSVIRRILPLLRLRRMLRTQEGGNVRLPDLTLPSNGERGRRMLVALVAMSDPGEPVSVEFSSHDAGGRRRMGGEELADELGTVIETRQEAHNVMVSSIGMSSFQSARLCASALLGSDLGRIAIAEMAFQGKSPVIAMLLALSADAADAGDDPWGNWLAASIRSVIGSVAYAEAVRDMVSHVCDRHDLGDSLDCRLLSDAESILGIDWHGLAERARVDYSAWQGDGGGHTGDPDSCGYGEWSDWDGCDDWDDRESSLYMAHAGEDDDTRGAERFLSVCRLAHVCRHAFRHLDGLGRRMLFAEYPALGVVLGDDGLPRDLHNDVVAASYEALCDLVVEDGYDCDGRIVGATIPGVVMDDGAVIRIHVDTSPGGGLVGRVSGDRAEDRCLLPADLGFFSSIEEITHFLFSASVEADDVGR